MRIAQVAPLWERVPPVTYGGTELVVGLLTDELVRRGHEVTLFASGDSITLARLEPIHPCAMRQDPSLKEYAVCEALELAQVYKRASEFDIIHSHVGYSSLPLAQLVKTPTVHTLHGIFTPDNVKIFTYFQQQPYVSISKSQRQALPELNYVATIYNGINVASYQFYPQPQQPPYLAFLGRFSPEKGPHHAIEIAKRTGLPLRMAGKVDVVDKDYFETAIKPHIDGKQIEFLGEVNHSQKNKLLGGAVATLFPITWREPFGLVMTESMATGTPVIAMALGSAPEIIVQGKTGFLCQSVDECVMALDRVSEIDRRACRQHVEQNFSVKSMVDGYEAVYRQIVANSLDNDGYIATSAIAA